MVFGEESEEVSSDHVLPFERNRSGNKTEKLIEKLPYARKMVELSYSYPPGKANRVAAYQW